MIGGLTGIPVRPLFHVRPVFSIWSAFSVVPDGLLFYVGPVFSMRSAFSVRLAVSICPAFSAVPAFSIWPALPVGPDLPVRPVLSVVSVLHAVCFSCRVSVPHMVCFFPYGWPWHLLTESLRCFTLTTVRAGHVLFCVRSPVCPGYNFLVRAPEKIRPGAGVAQLRARQGLRLPAGSACGARREKKSEKSSEKIWRERKK